MNLSAKRKRKTKGKTNEEENKEETREEDYCNAEEEEGDRLGGRGG